MRAVLYASSRASRMSRSACSAATFWRAAASLSRSGSPALRLAEEHQSGGQAGKDGRSDSTVRLRHGVLPRVGDGRTRPIPHPVTYPYARQLATEKRDSLLRLRGEIGLAVRTGSGERPA